jgi:hypothetical protein
MFCMSAQIEKANMEKTGLLGVKRPLVASFGVNEKARVARDEERAAELHSTNRGHAKLGGKVKAGSGY